MISAKCVQKPSRFILFIMMLGSVFLLPATSNAARPSNTGLSGLPFMNTTDIAARDELDIHFRTGMEKFEQEGTVDHVGNSAFGVIYGAYDGLELAAQLPYSYKEGKGYSGVPYFTIGAKYRFLGGRDKFYAMAASAIGNVGASDEKNNIGSGESGYSIELITSLKGGPKVSWHLMLGREKSDRKSFVSTTTTTSATYESVVKNKAALGFEYAMDSDFFLSLEAEGQVTTEDQDDNGIISAGVRYQASNILTYTLGLAFGVPDERSQPQNKVFAGIAYSFGKGTKTRAPTQHVSQKPSSPAPRSSLEEFMVRADVHNVPAEDLQTESTQRQVQQPRAQPPRTSPRTTRQKDVRIGVWNASGIKGLARKVANRLKERGYRVVRVKAAKRRQKKTMIFYKPGYSKQAIKVGHVIWKEQDVHGTRKLAKDVEIQVVVGFDLEQ